MCFLYPIYKSVHHIVLDIGKQENNLSLLPTPYRQQNHEKKSSLYRR